MIDEEALRAFLAERDALFCNLTMETATAYWEKQKFPTPVDSTVPLASAHKGRLQWLDATDAMIAESMQWLLARGYEPTLMGAPPLTPESRDAQRKLLRKPPLTMDS